jgi:glutaminase
MNFGEMVLFGQTTRSATVVADTETTCRILAADELDRISKQEPLLKIVLLENLGKDMANSLRRATQWIATLA